MRWAPRIALALASATIAVGAGACLVSVAGLTGGEPAGCTIDCGVAEGGTTVEGGIEAGEAADTGPGGADVACVPAATPEAGLDNDAMCGLSDGSTCAAGPVKTLSLVPWNPPQQACTEQQLNDFYGDCVENNGANCSTFQNSANNVGCAQCIFSLSTDTSYGAFIVYAFAGGAIGIVDVAGCVATLDPCEVPCATAIGLQSQCVRQACGPNCLAVDAGASGLLSCFADNSACPCEEYEHAASTCWARLVASKSPARTCAFQNGYAQAITAAAAAMCGGLDGGADAAAEAAADARSD